MALWLGQPRLTHRYKHLNQNLLAFSTTNILLAIIAIMSFVALQQPDYFYKWAYDPYLVKHRGQYWRLITHQFIHADLTHLLFNCFALYSFGNVAEALFQIKYPEIPFFYVGVYLISGVIAAIPNLVIHGDNTRYTSVGASGSISSLMLIYVMIFPMEKICLYFAICVPSILFGAIYLGYSFYGNRISQSNIDHTAHLWGALAGVAFALLLFTPEVFQSLGSLLP